MSTVIRVENLGKKYLLSHKEKSCFPTLRDAIVQKTSEVGRRLLHPLSASSVEPWDGAGDTEEFWALKDVSFEVKQGDRVGIIGRNGAGKSTLLKILSRITEPTTGKVAIKGRVASLLEVGTGFHPELTGRENIFLNGAILGMGKSEIRRKFDEIVDFAEVENFLDTPVKRYSSGMRVRLGFSVAAHLTAEILIIDEVLAVGDMDFQKKCLSKMEFLAQHGRTILFVSHQNEALSRLCEKGIYLCSGEIARAGGLTDCLDEYWGSIVKFAAEGELNSRNDVLGQGRVIFESIQTEGVDGKPRALFKPREDLIVRAVFRVTEASRKVEIGFPLSHQRFGYLSEINSDLLGEVVGDLSPGRYMVCCTLPRLPLNKGEYYADIYCRASQGVEFHLTKAKSFSVGDVLVGVGGRNQGRDRPFIMDHHFSVKRLAG